MPHPPLADIFPALSIHTSNKDVLVSQILDEDVDTSWRRQLPTHIITTNLCVSLSIVAGFSTNCRHWCVPPQWWLILLNAFCLLLPIQQGRWPINCQFGGPVCPIRSRSLDGYFFMIAWDQVQLASTCLSRQMLTALDVMLVWKSPTSLLLFVGNMP